MEKKKNYFKSWRRRACTSACWHHCWRGVKQ